MGAIYVGAIRLRRLKAPVLLDRFNVVQHHKRAVGEVRCQARRAPSDSAKGAFMRTRRLRLDNPWNPGPEERSRLSVLDRQTDHPIVRGCYLKETFGRFWDYLDKRWAQPYLEHWLWQAPHSRLERSVGFARIIHGHRDGIVAWTRLRAPNGALEGMNNPHKRFYNRT